MTDEPDDDQPTLERTGVLAGDPLLHRERDSALGALSLLRAPHLAPLLRAVAVGDAHALTHAVPVDGVDLATLRASVPLRPGQVVTVGSALLDALAVLHRAGLAHGGVDASRVLVAPDGCPVLAGTGLAWGVPPGAAHGPVPADDVAAVVRLVHELLGPGEAPGPLVLALLRADVDSWASDASDLADRLRAAVRPEPLVDLLWLVAAATGLPAAPTPAPLASTQAPLASTPGRRPVPRPRDTVAARASTPRNAVVPSGGGPRPGGVVRRAVVAVVAAAGLVAAAGAALAVVRGPGLASAAAPEPPAASRSASAPHPTSSWVSPSPSVPRPAPESVGAASVTQRPVPPRVEPVAWGDVLARLDDGRTQALAHGSLTELARWVDPGGAAWAADAALEQRLRESGAVLVGGGLERLDVVTVGASADRVVLRVRDIRTAYDVVVGSSRTRVPARAARWWEVTLADSEQGWRVRDVVAAAVAKDQ